MVVFEKQLDARMTSIDTTNKPFKIEKRQVYEAYKAVKSNKGAAGVDGQTIELFEADLGGNLYKIWNRMSSGSYFPPPVRAVTIPKKSGGERILGVPTVIGAEPRGSVAVFVCLGSGGYDSVVACRRPPICRTCRVPSWKLGLWNCWARCRS